MTAKESSSNSEAEDDSQPVAQLMNGSAAAGIDQVGRHILTYSCLSDGGDLHSNNWCTTSLFSCVTMHASSLKNYVLH